ncbi:hypothetical protein [Paenibacillus sp. GCM10028914]|uniref:hypothetical protein n=1 Tax=Paenibacillus sp. GCM10028914 TaxID=3273416 RepID=UPI0036098945
MGKSIKSKIILVEGIPGSGKTSTAKYIKELFDEYKIKSQLFLEGDVNHPADYESAAYLSEIEYKNLLEKYSDIHEYIIKFTEVKGENYIIYYGSMNKEIDINDIGINKELNMFDVYNLPLAMHKQLLIDKWKCFYEKVNQTDEVFILENCFLQNPITITLGRDNEPKEMIINYIQTLEDCIKLLNPTIIYFYQDNVEKTISRVIGERPEEWLRHLIYYFTEQGYGKANHLVGMKGVYEVLEIRKTIELEILTKLEMNKMIINNSDFEWNEILKKINKFLMVYQ